MKPPDHRARALAALAAGKTLTRKQAERLYYYMSFCDTEREWNCYHHYTPCFEVNYIRLSDLLTVITADARVRFRAEIERIKGNATV